MDDEVDPAWRWAVHGSRTVYDTRWVRITLDEVEPPGGARFEHHVLHLPRVAVALLVDDQDRVLMLWRYRFAVDQWGYELLGGLVELAEDPAQTAAREAREESGWRPIGPPEHLIGFEPLPGMITGRIDVYLWRAAEHIGSPLDPEQAGRVEWVDLDRIMTLAERGQLLGSGTLIALLYYLARRR